MTGVIFLRKYAFFVAHSKKQKTTNVSSNEE